VVVGEVILDALDYVDSALENMHTVEKSLGLERRVGSMARKIYKNKGESEGANQSSKTSVNAVVVNYSVGDFLIRVKNAARAKEHQVQVKNTKLIDELAKLLKKEGYLNEVARKDNLLMLNLTYIKKEPFLIDINLISKPGLRVYKSAAEIKKYRGPARLIVSTSKGLMMSVNAVKNNVGGEIIAEII
jgi:small subunit ribosomal protein S8